MPIEDKMRIRMKTKLLSLFMLGLALPSFGVEQDYADRAILTGGAGK
jgi:hypothetical protein